MLLRLSATGLQRGREQPKTSASRLPGESVHDEALHLSSATFYVHPSSFRRKHTTEFTHAGSPSPTKAFPTAGLHTPWGA
ncbi:hypothetical protein VZT92_016238 [Zoarces viviparus]|uniref:Uncharacterized protein n=1 Tax=Zoarces viviparus TaxID=48416 RepID=A0AAW1ESG6_ZOAVI